VTAATERLGVSRLSLSKALNENGGKRVSQQTGGTKRAQRKSDENAGIGQAFDNQEFIGADSQNRTVDPIITKAQTFPDLPIIINHLTKILHRAIRV
jgi:hypothetical protein